MATSTVTKILLRRGTEADLFGGSVTLSEGEPGFTTDTKELYVGDSAGNAVKVGSAPGGTTVVNVVSSNTITYDPGTTNMVTLCDKVMISSAGDSEEINPVLNVYNHQGIGAYITAASGSSSALGLYQDSATFDTTAGNHVGILTINATGIDVNTASIRNNTYGGHENKLMSCWDGAGNRIFAVSMQRGLTYNSYSSGSASLSIKNNNNTENDAGNSNISFADAHLLLEAVSGAAAIYYTSGTSLSANPSSDSVFKRVRWVQGQLSNSGPSRDTTNASQSGLGHNFKLLSQYEDVDGNYTNGAALNFNHEGQLHVTGGSYTARSLGLSNIPWEDIYSQNAVTVTSDERLKDRIDVTPLGLDFVNALRPVQYVYKTQTLHDSDGNQYTKQHHRSHHGFLAQEVKAALDKVGHDSFDFAGYIDPSENLDQTETLMLRYEEFISPLCRAVQELSEKVTDLEAKLDRKQDRNLHNLSKDELEAYGREVGIELDRRLTKDKLIEQLQEYLKTKKS